jgi:cyclic patellamide precursor peptide PatG
MSELESPLPTPLPEPVMDGAPPATEAPEEPAEAAAEEEVFEPTFVYAIGRIEPRFPSPAVERELAHATGRADVAGQSDPEAMRSVLSLRANRYLVRQLLWVMTVQGFETYIVVPRDPVDLELLVDALRPRPRADDVDVVIGVLGPNASPEATGGLALPILLFDQIYSFDVDALVHAIPRPEGVAAETFEPVAEALFRRLIQIADNAGATDEHRALNYLAVRYDAIYAAAAEAYARNETLAAVEVKPSPLGGGRKVVDVVFTFRHRETSVLDKLYARVDVTEEFVFLVTPLSPYYER